MAHYRIHRLNAAGRVAGTGFDVICPDDRKARALAKRLLEPESRADTRDDAKAQPTAAVVIKVNAQRTSRRDQAAQAPTWGHADLFRFDVVSDPIEGRVEPCPDRAGHRAAGLR